MTRKISGHDGELVVNDAVELEGRITGGLVVEPGGSVVIHGSLAGPTVSVGAQDDDPNDDEHDEPGDRPGGTPDDHRELGGELGGELGSVISDIP